MDLDVWSFSLWFQSRVFFFFGRVRSLPFKLFSSSLLYLTFSSACLNMIPDAGSPFLRVQSALWQIVTWPKWLLFFFTLYPLSLADTVLNFFWDLSRTVRHLSIWRLFILHGLPRELWECIVIWELHGNSKMVAGSDSLFK